MVPELLEGLDNLIYAERNNLAATAENPKRPTRKRKQNDKKYSKQQENKKNNTNNKLNKDESEDISIPAENSTQKNKIDLKDFDVIVNTLNK